MTQKRSISIVIPVYNMGSHLPEQMKSYDRCGLLSLVDEIVFVNDGSTDDTREHLTRLCQDESLKQTQLTLVDLPQNAGRFHARFAGARQCRSTHILFLDCRLTLPQDFGASLKQLFSNYSCLMGHVDIDIDRNVYCLYWDRSHKFIFRSHFKKTQKRVVIDFQNYDAYLKGTTVFLCPKETFIQACEKYANVDLLSDDTFLMKEICLAPSLRVSWLPRENAYAFLARLWERGPSFAEYHVFTSRGRLFYALMLGTAFLLACLISLLLLPPVGLTVIGLSFLMLFLSTALFAKSVKEFFVMSPLHVGVVVTFVTAAYWGILVNIKRIWFDKKFRGLTPKGS